MTKITSNRIIMLRFLLIACAAFLFSTHALASPNGTMLRADYVAPKTAKIDGIPKEWAMMKLDTFVRGSASRPDLEAKGGLSYDDDRIYVYADIIDDRFLPGRDHIELILVFPEQKPHILKIFPGEPGKSPGHADTSTGAISNAKVVEAPKHGGYSLEASIPWDVFPESKTTRIKLRAGLFVHDFDSTAEKNILGNASSSAVESLPFLLMEPEQALVDGLFHDKSIAFHPSADVVANVTGSNALERILIVDRYMVVVGSQYRKGTEYYFAEIAPESMMASPSLEVKDITADGFADLLLTKTLGTKSAQTQVLQVFSFLGGDIPKSIFGHEITVTTPQGTVSNALQFSTKSISVKTLSAKGLNASNYQRDTTTSFDPILLPWENVESQTYEWNGSMFQKTNEQRRAPSTQATKTTSQPVPTAAATPNPSSAFDAYRRDKHFSANPRIKLQADLLGSTEKETIALCEKDIVVFGTGLNQGQTYAYTTLSQFTVSSDILDVSTRDVTGDNKSEILVRGKMQSKLVTANESIAMEREVLFIFQLTSNGLRRLFAIELKRSAENKNITHSIRFDAPGVISIDIAKVTGWSQKTYPFAPQETAAQDIFPVIPPWGLGIPRKFQYENGKWVFLEKK